MSEKKYHYIRKTFRYNGKRYEVTGKTEAEAEEKLALLRSRLELMPFGNGVPLTVSEWYQQWKSLYKDNSGMTTKSLSAYDEKFRKYIEPAIGKIRLDHIQDQHLQKILNDAAGMSFSQLTKIRSLLQQMFFRALKSRLISYNPADGLELPAYTRNNRRSLTDEERALFLQVEPTVPGAVLYYTMLMTGMRPGELAVLQWSDIDFQKNEISVTKALESGSRTSIRGPKTAAGVRVIPMRPQLVNRLLPLQGKPDDFVFRREDGKHFCSNSLHKLWHTLREAMEDALGSELPDDLVPYCLRHTFCTDLQNAGVPINVAKELMGHSNISTTANVYTHRNESTLHNNIALLDRPKPKATPQQVRRTLEKPQKKQRLRPKRIVNSKYCGKVRLRASPAMQ